MEAKQVNYIKNDILTKKLIGFLKDNNSFVAKEDKPAKKTTKKSTKKAEDAPASEGEEVKAPAKKRTCKRKTEENND